MIFLTGATGFLGSELAARLLAMHPEKKLCLLARGESDELANNRIMTSVGAACEPAGVRDFASRIQVVRGELTEEHYGLGASEFKKLSSEIDSVYHCAASTKFSLPLEEARSINVAGTKNAIALALAAKNYQPNMRLHHVSTAYVAGKQEKVISPDQLSFNQGFRNSYEQSKAEAEALIRAEGDRLQSTVYRPSVIVGDSRTGRTSTFNVIYMPARLLINGVCKALPALPNTPFDVVPVDYIADAIAHLGRNQCSAGATYHLTAGVGRESSPLEIVTMLVNTFDRYKRSLPSHLRRNLLVAPELLLKAFDSFSAAAANISMKQLEKIVTEHISVFSQLLPFIPYMISNPQFDARSTAKDLEGEISLPPMFAAYGETVFRYCFETNWGRRTA